MNAIFAIPEESRLVLLLLLGAAIGTQINRGIYSLAYQPRRISPWSPPPPEAPPRRWYDRLPVFGWLTVSREASLHGTGYWIRPLCIELFCAAGVAGLYAWETGHGLLPADLGLNPPPELLHSVFLAHLVLCPLMLVATFIDVDEQIIPDSITVPGTMAALVLAACLPLSALPIAVKTAAGLFEAHPLRLVSPEVGNFPAAPWPDCLSGGWGLALGLGCWWAWYLVVVPKTIWLRGGWLLAMCYMVVSIRRHRPSLWMTGAVIVGTPAMVGVWRVGGESWKALLSALVGMAFGGGIVWAVRILGSSILKKEAMGFGDVTLMAMIGAFLGWQASLIAFFLAPFAGLAIALPQKLIQGRQDIAYGPFLCLASLVTIVGWPVIWEGQGRRVFGMGWLLPAMLAASLVLIVILWGLWRLQEARRK